ncbi:ORF4 protein [Armillaria borealis mycovirgavirus 1]|nr:ORF4 protein [Armillaria borealis mycovirgavirus 1]
MSSSCFICSSVVAPWDDATLATHFTSAHGTITFPYSHTGIPAPFADRASLIAHIKANPVTGGAGGQAGPVANTSTNWLDGWGITSAQLLSAQVRDVGSRTSASSVHAAVLLAAAESIVKFKPAPAEFAVSFFLQLCYQSATNDLSRYETIDIVDSADANNHLFITMEALMAQVEQTRTEVRFNTTKKTMRNYAAAYKQSGWQLITSHPAFTPLRSTGIPLSNRKGIPPAYWFAVLDFLPQLLPRDQWDEEIKKYYKAKTKAVTKIDDTTLEDVLLEQVDPTLSLQKRRMIQNVMDNGSLDLQQKLIASFNN